MIKVSYLETRPSSRYAEHDPKQTGNKNTIFADIIIDGNSLYQKLKKYDLVPALGWGSEEHQRLMIEYFLLKSPFELMYHRYPILVCPWCGDLECGYISVSIGKESDIVEWSNFQVTGSNNKLEIGPYYFKWDNYKYAIESALGVE
ncbi:hypothetical protein SAMN05216191_10489 [Paenibacillus jilunlii]|uniref:Oxidoreductase n=2 Tax=Paenibacillus jilunlii TaxID=682956 RepID=A0A1G9LIA1_9BACL|nr:hypothetical protein [Paenibacillus jilunlii]KWX74234.1 oxidoreductase [Paenibacillus jilunlii]SDL61672.1 hypothetical protein SAMN05216191_10489 [Paenibacillus jilunlii]